MAALFTVLSILVWFDLFQRAVRLVQALGPRLVARAGVMLGPRVVDGAESFALIH